MGEHNPNFKPRLQASNWYVEKVAKYLEEHGHNVERHYDPTIAPTPEDSIEYADHGDLHVDGKRVEVKFRSTGFQSKSDWKESYALICAEKVLARAVKEEALPHVFITVNITGDYVALVHWFTRDMWTLRTVNDSGRKLPHLNWSVDIEHVLFAPFDKLDEFLFL